MTSCCRARMCVGATAQTAPLPPPLPPPTSPRTAQVRPPVIIAPLQPAPQGLQSRTQVPALSAAPHQGPLTPASCCPGTAMLCAAPVTCTAVLPVRHWKSHRAKPSPAPWGTAPRLPCTPRSRRSSASAQQAAPVCVCVCSMRAPGSDNMNVGICKRTAALESAQQAGPLADRDTIGEGNIALLEVLRVLNRFPCVRSVRVPGG